MILADTGPLVAFGDLQDPFRDRIEAIIARIPEPMLTTEACRTESLYLIGRAAGVGSRGVIWQMIRSGLLSVFQAPDTSPLRAADYMLKFHDQPCDYADATLLVAAEETGIQRILTLDGHFYAYRLSSGDSMRVLT